MNRAFFGPAPLTDKGSWLHPMLTGPGRGVGWALHLHIPVMDPSQFLVNYRR
jgi:hypothetical protein